MACAELYKFCKCMQPKEDKEAALVLQECNPDSLTCSWSEYVNTFCCVRNPFKIFIGITYEVSQRGQNHPGLTLHCVVNYSSKYTSELG